MEERVRQEEVRRRVSHCACCGRALTNEDSVRAGFGPVCGRRQATADCGEMLGGQPVLVGVPPVREVGLVCVRLSDGRLSCNVPHVVVHHSPDGFECGYGGSGPAELALNVLHALLPPRGDHMDRVFRGVVVSNDAAHLYQDFKRAVIEPMPREGGRVPIEDIQQWIAQRLIAEAA